MASEWETEIEELRRRLEEAEETLRAVRSGEVDALVVSGADGERVFTLQGADHPYRALIEAMQQGAVTLSGDGTILYCNQGFATMLQRPHERIVGTAVTDYVPPAQQRTLGDLIEKGRQARSQAEVQLQVADGAVVPALVSVAPLALTEAVTLCMVVTDLTEQKKHQDMQQANRRKDEFLAMLGHELRNPLAPIRGAIELLRGGTDDATAAAAREIMDRQVQHMVRLVDDLLDISRLVRGGIELKKETIDLATVIQHAVEESQPFIEERGHELKVSLPATAVWVHADQIRLVQVMVNLLNNAAKYTERQGRIYLTIETQDDWAVVRVRDTGIGIADEMLPRVFELFSQADGSLDRSKGGLGIGLAIVHTLVEMHGGSIEVHSEGPDQGSEFVVRLPTCPAVAKNESRAWRPRKVAAKRVLVVDDNAGAARVLAMLLEKFWGHHVEIAFDGEAALEAAKIHRPELVLLDIGLPGMDGYEVAKCMRSDPELSGAMIVALTGYGQEDDHRRSLEAGFDEHLVKPVSVAGLELLFTQGKLAVNV